MKERFKSQGLGEAARRWEKEHLSTKEGRDYILAHPEDILAGLGQIFGQSPPKPDDRFAISGTDFTARSAAEKLQPV